VNGKVVRDMVSVVMPVYNGIQYLGAAIDSVLNQTHKDFEFLIIDDGSTEDVVNFIKSYTDDRIVFVSRENRGLGATLNQLVGLAKYDLIFRMDADDICDPQRIELQLNYMNNNPSVVICGGAIKFLVENVVIDGFFPVTEHSSIRKSLLQARFPLCHPSIVFRKKIFDKIGGYRLDGAGEDLDFFLRMSEVGVSANIREFILYYRLSKNSLALRKAKDLEIGYAYALHAARDRRLGLEDFGFSHFKDNVWHRVGLVVKIKARFRSLSELFYRKSLFSLARNEFVLRYFYLIIASILRPVAVITRIFRIR
jgi:glycosyltransferase involved in cell wall biosynthesis